MNFKVFSCGKPIRRGPENRNSVWHMESGFRITEMGGAL